MSAQKFKDFDFQFYNTTGNEVTLTWETYDLKPGSNGTIIPLKGSLVEQTLRINKKNKFLRFSGKAAGLNINPVVFEINSLKKPKNGSNLTYLIIEETPKGNNIDLSNLVQNITNQHFYKLLAVKDNERYGTDEVTRIGTFVVVDSSDFTELSKIPVVPPNQAEVITNEYAKEETYFVDKYSIVGVGVQANLPKFAAGINVSLVDSGFVEIKFKIQSVQHMTWNGQSPYDYLKTPRGRTLVNDIRDLYNTNSISPHFSDLLYFKLCQTQ